MTTEPIWRTCYFMKVSISLGPSLFASSLMPQSLQGREWSSQEGRHPPCSVSSSSEQFPPGFGNASDHTEKYELPTTFAQVWHASSDQASIHSLMTFGHVHVQHPMPWHTVRRRGRPIYTDRKRRCIFWTNVYVTNTLAALNMFTCA